MWNGEFLQCQRNHILGKMKIKKENHVVFQQCMIVILHKPNLISLRLDFRRYFLLCLCLWPLYLQPILHLKSKSRRLRPNPILLLRLLSKVHFTDRQHWHCHCRLKRIRMSIFSNLTPQNPHLGNDHLTWKGGWVLCFFFLKKYSYSQCCWKKYSDFGGGKNYNLIQSFYHI